MLYDKKWDYQLDTPLAATLRRARQLIENPDDWSPNGWGKVGEQMCGIHAVCFAENGHHHGDISGEAHDVFRVVTGDFFGTYNDTHSHAEVLAKFDEAIAYANRR